MQIRYNGNEIDNDSLHAVDAYFMLAQHVKQRTAGRLDRLTNCRTIFASRRKILVDCRYSLRTRTGDRWVARECVRDQARLF